MQYCGRPGTWHLREGTKDLNRNQKAAARQLSLAAYLLFSAGRAKDEASIAENLPPYGAVYDASLGEDGDREHAGYDEGDGPRAGSGMGRAPVPTKISKEGRLHERDRRRFSGEA
ncbi:MAG: hypothetical protein H0U02_12120, partial [Rubrobacter sp.]|nr:hypothetical protein [Rubrobacter sp.]